MKFEDYDKLEQTLLDCKEKMLKAYNEADTSAGSNGGYSTFQDIIDWKGRFLTMLDEIETLRMEMIFTFKIED